MILIIYSACCFLWREEQAGTLNTLSISNSWQKLERAHLISTIIVNTRIMHVSNPWV